MYASLHLLSLLYERVARTGDLHAELVCSPGFQMPAIAQLSRAFVSPNRNLPNRTRTQPCSPEHFRNQGKLRHHEHRSPRKRNQSATHGTPEEAVEPLGGV